MPRLSSSSRADRLFRIAEEQQGYFTTKQAASAGYRLGSQAHHVKSGNWTRIERGIYRLKRFPQSAEEQLVVYALWSRNRAGTLEGVYSDQTALRIHELSDVNPSKLHMTVPPTFRRTATTPKVLVLHRRFLDEKDIEQREGFTVTRPLRSIADVAASESISRDLVEQALVEGQRHGLFTSRQITELRGQEQLPEWFDALLARCSR